MRKDFFNEQVPTKKISEKKTTNKTSSKEDFVEEIELEPRSSFLKNLNYTKMESLGRVHNSEIIELNAIIDKDGETHLMIVSKDGLIKLYQEEAKSESTTESYSQKRSFYVSERGITCSCVLNSQESVVIGTADNNIILFNFSTGTEIGNFYAHDNDISNISVIGNNLISFSYDTTLKIWNMLNSDFAHPKVFYDHEDAIISADVWEKSVIQNLKQSYEYWLKNLTSLLNGDCVISNSLNYYRKTLCPFPPLSSPPSWNWKNLGCRQNLM